MSVEHDDNSYECDDDSSNVSDRLPNTNNMIRGQKDTYAVGKKIAPGKYGAVYEVSDILSMELNQIWGLEGNVSSGRKI